MVNKTIELTGIGGGPTKIDTEGGLLGYGTVCYHLDVALNIMFLYTLTKQFKSVTYNNKT